MTGARRIISVDSSGNVETVETEDARLTRERLRSLAWLLDSSIPIPGTRFTIGVDALIGLFPVVVGVVPFAGDLFDAAWKANQRNVRLLDAWLDRPEKAERSSRTFVAILIAGVALLLVLVGLLGYLLLRWIVGLYFWP